MAPEVSHPWEQHASLGMLCSGGGERGQAPPLRAPGRVSSVQASAHFHICPRSAGSTSSLGSGERTPTRHGKCWMVEAGVKNCRNSFSSPNKLLPLGVKQGCTRAGRGRGRGSFILPLSSCVAPAFDTSPIITPDSTSAPERLGISHLSRVMG